MKANLINLNEDYNVIIMERDSVYEHYLEKIGYGNLLHLFSVKEKMSKDELLTYLDNNPIEDIWG